MKFGRELDQRSILKWKHNNIHYNDLKQKIKIVTSIARNEAQGQSEDDLQNQRSSVSSINASQDDESIQTTYPSDHLRQRALLKDLYKSFSKEIDFVSLFVNTENMRLSQDLIRLGMSIEQFITTFRKLQQEQKQNDSQSFKDIRQRKFIRICNETYSLLDSYRDLSQFINLQKLALRKLFKKFLKHSSLSNKEEFIQHIKDHYLEGKADSFVNLNLNDAIKELMMIMDILNSINENKKVSFPSATNIDSAFTKANKFDILSITKGVFAQSFLVHQDNVNELTVKLLKDFEFVTDEDFELDNSNITNDNLIKKTASHVNLHKSARSLSRQNSCHDVSAVTPEEELESSKQDIETEAIVLSPVSLDHHHSTIIKLQSEKDQYLLIAKVGGFKNVSYTKLSSEALNILLDTTMTTEAKVPELKKHITGETDLHCINWALSSKITCLFELKYHRSRFLLNNKQQSYFISLNSNIRFSKAGGLAFFPHSILTISYNDNEFQFPPQLNGLISSHLVYRMPQDFSLVNFLFWTFYSRELIKDPESTSPPQWVEDIVSLKDIKKMPPTTAATPTTATSSSAGSILAKQKQQHPSGVTSAKSILLNNNRKQENRAASNKIKYWNEFDNGSDVENDDSFYITVPGQYDSEANLEPAQYDYGDDDAQLFSVARVNSILHLANKLVNFINSKILPKKQSRANGSRYRGRVTSVSPSLSSSTGDSRDYFLHHHQKNYGATRAYESDTDDEHESFRSSSPPENNRHRYPSPPFAQKSKLGGQSAMNAFENNRISLQKTQYDKVLTFLYFFIVFCSVIVNGLSIGILFSLRTNSVANSSSSAAVLVFVFCCLFLGLLLSISGICLISFRYIEAPVQHHAIVYCVLAINLCVISMAIFWIAPELA